MSQYTGMRGHTGHLLRTFGKEQEFRPHNRHIEPLLTECDLDWKSRLRWIPEPRYNDAPFPHIKDIKFPSEIRLMRSFPQANMVSQSEWSFYPNCGQPKTYHTGKRCFIDGINHIRSVRCTSENSLELAMGRKKHSTEKFSISSATRSKPFLVPEYSPDFHKYRSTIPTTTFGSFKADTLVRLKRHPEDLCKPYTNKHKIHEQEEDRLEVKRLNNWRPAPGIYDRTVLQET